MAVNLASRDGKSRYALARGPAGTAQDSDVGPPAVSVWEDMIATLRDRIGLDCALLDDDAIAFSLAEIDRFVEPHARWQAAFDSTLGLCLALRGCDVESALAPIVANRTGTA